jgi:hypothetical protein
MDTAVLVDYAGVEDGAVPDTDSASTIGSSLMRSTVTRAASAEPKTLPIFNPAHADKLLGRCNIANVDLPQSPDTPSGVIGTETRSISWSAVRSTVVVVEADDVVLAEVVAPLHFDEGQKLRCTGVRDPVGCSDGHVDG